MKTQSKKMNQLKYLLLIPVLASMLFYVSCSEDFAEETQQKQPVIMYTISKDGTLTISQQTKATYLDSFMGGMILEEFTEITERELNKSEKLEYLEQVEFYNKTFGNKDYTQLKLFQMKGGRKVVGVLYDFDKMRNRSKTETLNEIVVKEEVNFIKVDKAPTFGDCETGDKVCFSKNIQSHFSKKFDGNLPNRLGLQKGMKRVFIQFTIDKQGNTTDIKVRAPHEEIEKEVIRVMESLPKMKPGEMNGEVVKVKYSIPFTIIVE